MKSIKPIKVANVEFHFVELDEFMSIEVGDYFYRVEYYTAPAVQEPTIATLEEVVEIINGGTHPSKGYYEDIPSVDCSHTRQEWTPGLLRIPVRVRRWRDQNGFVSSPLDEAARLEARRIYLSNGEVEVDMTHLVVEPPTTTEHYEWREEEATAYYRDLIEREVLPDYLRWVEEKAEKKRKEEEKAQAEEAYLASPEHAKQMADYQPVIDFLNKKSFDLKKVGENEALRSLLKSGVASVVYRWGEYYLAVDSSPKCQLKNLMQLIERLGYRAKAKPVLRKK
ncbi:hypothetical protein AVV41_gp067 [Microcystis phage MaMV-DC]|uniref:Uncharacterized protein n=1 Tax=Microcystis phage MaMV-DC TaxID=1357715 RepID=A0A075BS54_9CAUD|nr:hypothetical protein AVV41_gp067 [Microcystis phage MaMV-DC]AGR48632.1 hypothetical protein MaMVDC_67 [Microcystis phage MaMV-DC]